AAILTDAARSPSRSAASWMRRGWSSGRGSVDKRTAVINPDSACARRARRQDADVGEARNSQQAEPLTERKAWNALITHYRQIQAVHLRDLFGNDPARGERMTAEAAGLFLDYSKHRLTDETLELLVALAEESGLRT